MDSPDWRLEPKRSHRGQTNQLTTNSWKGRESVSLGRRVQLDNKDPGWENRGEFRFGEMK